MRPLAALTLAAVCALWACGAAAAPVVPAAIYADPPPDAAHPARMAVLHIPSHGVAINGVAYLASGAGRHPSVVLLHGLPGNEKNLDLAQAIRRAGWIGQTLEDADAVLAYVRGNAASLQVDTGRLVIIGHSMGGWVAINTAAHDGALIGLVSISAGDFARVGGAPGPIREKVMADNMEALAGVTAESMAQDVAAVGPAHPLPAAAGGLMATPYLALTSDDGLAADTDALVAAIRSRGGTKVTTLHVATDHSWSDHRIALETAIVGWLQRLR